MQTIVLQHGHSDNFLYDDFLTKSLPDSGHRVCKHYSDYGLYPTIRTLPAGVELPGADVYNKRKQQCVSTDIAIVFSRM